MKLIHFFFEMTTRSRILLTSLILTLTLTLITAGLAVKEYRNDKLAYLHELHAARTAVAAARLREKLSALTTKASSTSVAQRLPNDLQRPPYGNEIFVSFDNGKLNIFFSRDNNEIFAQEITSEFVENALESVAGTPMLVVSQAGPIIYSQNSNLTELDTGTLIQGIFKSQMTEGHTVFQLRNQDMAVGFREVPDTNLLVVAFTPLKTLLQPLREGTRAWLLMIVPIFALGLILQSWILRRIDKPLRQMNDIFRTLVNGRWDAAIAVPRGEFAPVFAGAAALQQAVAEREARLRLLAAGLKQTIEFSHEQALARDFRTSARKLSELLSPVIKLHPNFGPRFFDHEEDILWTLQDDNKWHPTTADQSFLKHELENSELARGGICTNTINNEIFEELLIPILDEGKRRGAILVPLAQHQHLAELWNLAPVICQTLSEMILRCKSGDRAAREAQVEHELSLARQMLERSLVLDATELSSVWISSLFEPAENVGGDWMGVFPHPEAGIVNIYVGDVTGHGLDSAFHASLIAGAIKASESDLSMLLRQSPDLQFERNQAFDAREYLKSSWQRLNGIFLNSAGEKMMTMLFMSFNLHTGTLTLLSAGHPAPLCIAAGDSRLNQRHVFLSNPAPPLGSAAGKQDIAPEIFNLEAGDILLAFTDGFEENIEVSEGHITKRTISRAAINYLQKWQNKNDTPLEELYQWSLNAGHRYNRADDVSLLAFKYLGASRTQS